MSRDGGIEPAAPGHVVRIRALESTFRVETQDAEVAERLRREWSRCLVEHPVSGEIAVPADRRHRTLDDVTYSLASSITLRAIEAAVGRFVMFHACGLVDDAGRTAVLVAPSGTGKTTAAATLARDRFGYLTDEAVVLREDGTLLPYPKPLSMVKPTGGKAQFGPDELGLRPCPAAPRLGALVLLDRVQDGDVAPRLERVPLLDAALALLPQTSALPSLDRPLQRLFDAIDRCGGVHRLTYSEIGRAAPVLRDLLATDSPPAESWSAILPAPDHHPAEPTPAGGTSFIRCEVRDAVQVGSDAILMRRAVPVRLSGIGTTIWRVAQHGSDLAGLMEAAVRENGPHPDAEALVRDAVRAMVASGVLREARAA